MKWYLPLLLCGSAFAQGTVQGPTVGWVWDDRSQSLRAILGIPGSSVLSAPASAGFALSAGLASNSGDWAVLLNANEQSAYTATLRDGAAPRLMELAAGVSRVSLSPRGSAGVFFYEQARKLVVVKNLPASAEVAAEFDVTNEGMPDAVAVADDGAGILALYAGEVVAFRDGNRWKVEGATGVSSVVFLDNRADALLAGKRGVTLISEVFSSARVQPLRDTSAVAAAVTGDGKTALILESSGDAAERTLVSYNFASAEVQAVACSCNPTTVVRLSSGVFRINDFSDGPLWLAELTATQSRTVFVPADAKTEE